MRWGFISTLVLVLLYWQYQSWTSEPESDERITETLASNTFEPEFVQLEQTNKVSLPEVSQAEEWLQPSLKTLFDHYLLEYEQDSVAMWHAFDRHCLTLNDCAKVTDLFKRYIDYKQALANIDDTQQQTVAEISIRLEQLADVKNRFFSEQEIMVLFGEENRWQQSALQRFAIRQDPSLSEQQKQQLLNLHYQSLQGTEAAAIAPSLQLQKVVSLNKAKQIDNYNLLAAEFGADTADRLIALKEKQAAWQLKVTKFESESRQLANRLSGSRLTEAINGLKADMFTENEIKRLKVLSSSSP